MSQLTDDLFSALSDQYRRRLLVALLECNSQAELAVPEQIYREEIDPERIHMKMRHIHLPKLEAMGFVDWDRERETITRGPQFDQIQPYLRMIYEHRNELPSDWF